MTPLAAILPVTLEGIARRRPDVTGWPDWRRARAPDEEEVEKETEVEKEPPIRRDPDRRRNLGSANPLD